MYTEYIFNTHTHTYLHTYIHTHKHTINYNIRNELVREAGTLDSDLGLNPLFTTF